MNVWQYSYILHICKYIIARKKILWKTTAREDLASDKDVVPGHKDSTEQEDVAHHGHSLPDASQHVLSMYQLSLNIPAFANPLLLFQKEQRGHNHSLDPAHKTRTLPAVLVGMLAARQTADLLAFPGSSSTSETNVLSIPSQPVNFSHMDNEQCCEKMRIDSDSNQVTSEQMQTNPVIWIAYQ